MNDVMKIIKLFGDSGVLIDGVTKTVKNEIKKEDDGSLPAFLAPLVASIVQPINH